MADVPGIKLVATGPMQPVTADEWTEAIAAAVFCLALDAARLYGLVTGGPEVNVERTESLLADARRLGYPIPDIEEILG